MLSILESPLSFSNRFSNFAAKIFLKSGFHPKTLAQRNFKIMSRMEASEKLPNEIKNKFDSVSVSGSKSVNFLEISGKGLKETANSISNFEIAPIEPNSRFVKPYSIYFNQNQKKRRWDMVGAHPSVAIILYHIDLDSMLLVRQFRPPVYIAELLSLNENKLDNHNNITNKIQLDSSINTERGFTYELCAGIIDKSGKSLTQIAKEEIAEEMGYDVAVHELKKVANCVTSVGTTGAPQTFFFATVKETMRISQGGGNDGEGEDIDVVALPRNEFHNFILDSNVQKSPGVMFGVMWLHNFLNSK